MATDSLWQVTKGRRALYWSLQLLGWTAYFGYVFTFWSHTARGAAAWLVVMLSHLLGSHVLRTLIKRRGWVGLRARRLLPRLFGCVCVLAVAVQVICTPFAVAIGAARLQDQLRYSGLIAIASIALFSLWSALYLGFEYAFLYRTSQIERLELEANLREAELQTLRSQVNPHFLFNCLNNLRSLIAEDSERAREMLLKLSELLRYTLDAARQERVPLSEELQVVEAYLNLEHMQFEERLVWKIDVPAQALEMTVPPMLVQQLVENAVKHGIAKLQQGGEILVIGRVAGNVLSLRVENTGQLSATPGVGVGLNNARERLRMLCGAGASLRVHGVDGGRVAAQAEIPLQPA